MTTHEEVMERLDHGVDDDIVATVLARFVHAVRSRYGDDIAGIFLYGSRARGDHTRMSDVDLAVVFRNGDFSPVERLMDLADIAYDPLVEEGVEIRPFPVSEANWLEPGENRFLSNVRHDAVELFRAD